MLGSKLIACNKSYVHDKFKGQGFWLSMSLVCFWKAQHVVTQLGVCSWYVEILDKSHQPSPRFTKAETIAK